jgi:murein L,D-transpeptidase YafK
MKRLTGSRGFRRTGSIFVLLALLWSVTFAADQRAAFATPTVDRIVVAKADRTMTLMQNGKAFKTYKVALSREPVGPKEREGDHRVPEGMYTIDSKNAHSRFHLALHVSYPNAADRERAGKLGVKPGGNIEIHGLGNTYGWVGSLQRQIDWTDGCIAVTNSEIDEIWSMVPVGTPLEIRP